MKNSHDEMVTHVDETFIKTTKGENRWKGRAYLGMTSDSARINSEWTDRLGHQPHSDVNFGH